MYAGVYQRPVERFGATTAWVPTIFAPHHRIMYDTTGGMAGVLVQLHPEMVLGYDTGSGGIQWTPPDWSLFPGIPHVHVDQAGQGAPVYSAHVMDIEPGAYAPTDLPGWMAHATAPRPTAYVDRNDCDTILANGYKGPIHLAWPGWNGEPLPGAPGQVVAVQNVFQNSYDASVVLDATWPYKKTEAEMLNGILSPHQDQLSIPFPAGSFNRIILFHDFTSAAISLRVAYHSAHRGWTIHDHYALTGNAPQTIAFNVTDADAVSLVNEDQMAFVGWTLA